MTEDNDDPDFEWIDGDGAADPEEPAAAPPPYAPPPYSAPPAFASAPAFAPPPGAAAAPTMAGDASGLIQRILNITLKPKSEWPVIAAEPPSLARILVGCVIPLAAIQSVLGFIHRVVIGVSVPFIGNVRMPVASGLAVAVMGFVFALIGMFVLALIVNAWAPFFAARRNLAESLKVAAYAAVPGWLGSFFGILPVLGVLVGLLAGLYAIYVLYLGLPVVMRGPKEKALGYTVAVTSSTGDVFSITRANGAITFPCTVPATATTRGGCPGTGVAAGTWN